MSQPAGKEVEVVFSGLLFFGSFAFGELAEDRLD
jgi:hypothetical protein